MTDDLTGIVVGVTLFEPPSIGGDRVRDCGEGADRGQLCSGVTPRGLRVSGGGWTRGGTGGGKFPYKLQTLLRDGMPPELHSGHSRTPQGQDPEATEQRRVPQRLWFFLRISSRATAARNSGKSRR